MACPGFVKAGSSAVTITAAAFLPDKPDALVTKPNWLTIACIDCKSKPEFPSPEPARPTTIPYPTNGLSLTPLIEVKSLSLSACTFDTLKKAIQIKSVMDIICLTNFNI